VQSAVSDERVAEASLLQSDEYSSNYITTAFQRVVLDADLAATLPECAAFTAAFPSGARPAVTASRWFADRTAGLALQFVMVLPDKAAAKVTFDAIAAAGFDDACMPAYLRHVRRTSCCAFDEDYVPFQVGNRPSPHLGLPGDQTLVRENEGTWVDPGGHVHGPDRVTTVTLRVGRTITHAEFITRSAEGRSVTLPEVMTAAANMALRARAAQDGTPY
jgi:hypothetical protein